MTKIFLFATLLALAPSAGAVPSGQGDSPLVKEGQESPSSGDSTNYEQGGEGSNPFLQSDGAAGEGSIEAYLSQGNSAAERTPSGEQSPALQNVEIEKEEKEIPSPSRRNPAKPTEAQIAEMQRGVAERAAEYALMLAGRNPDEQNLALEREQAQPVEESEDPSLRLVREGPGSILGKRDGQPIGDQYEDLLVRKKEKKEQGHTEVPVSSSSRSLNDEVPQGEQGETGIKELSTSTSREPWRPLWADEEYEAKRQQPFIVRSKGPENLTEADVRQQVEAQNLAHQIVDYVKHLGDQATEQLGKVKAGATKAGHEARRKAKEAYLKAKEFAHAAGHKAGEVGTDLVSAAGKVKSKVEDVGTSAVEKFIYGAGATSDALREIVRTCSTKAAGAVESLRKRFGDQGVIDLQAKIADGTLQEEALADADAYIQKVETQKETDNLQSAKFGSATWKKIKGLADEAAQNASSAGSQAFKFASSVGMGNAAKMFLGLVLLWAGGDFVMLSQNPVADVTEFLTAISDLGQCILSNPIS